MEAVPGTEMKYFMVHYSHGIVLVDILNCRQYLLKTDKEQNFSNGRSLAVTLRDPSNPS